MTPVSDEELMDRFRASGCEEAFEALSRRHLDAAYRTVLSMLRDPSAAEDVLQETFLKMVRARRTYRPGRPFAPWFYTILRNACQDELRRRRVVLAGDGMPDLADTGDPSAALLATEDARTARRAFGLLPDAEQEVLALRIHGELAFAEIASVCGVSVEAAKKRAQRGLARLRRSFARLR